MNQLSTVTSQFAFGILKQITKKTAKPTVNFDGTITVEIGEVKKEYTLVIEGSWVIDSGKKQLWSQNFVALRDEDEIRDLIGTSQISGVDLGDKRFTFVMANGIEINIMDYSRETNRYFTLTPHITTEDQILSLNSNFTYSLTPLVDSILK